MDWKNRYHSSVHSNPNPNPDPIPKPKPNPNHDETPQFINTGVDGTPNGLVYAGRGKPCKRIMRENRECVNISSVVSLSGVIRVCQVIFGTKGITNQMAPKEAVEKIDNHLILITDSGCQDHTSLLACYKLFDKYLDMTGIERPVVLTSNGHSSRFDFEILKFCNEKRSVFEVLQ